MNRAARRAQQQQQTKTSRTRRVAALGSGAVLALSAGGTAMTFASQSASAAVNDVVTNLDDAGAGSLRDAILDANANGGGTITFDAALSGSITLASDLPDIAEDVTIAGPASGAVTVDGDGNQTFYVSGAALTISNLTVSGSDFAGITVFHGGTVTADHMTISGNSNFNSRGGGITCGRGESLTNSTVIVTNSVISGNVTNNGGGGLYSNTCDTTIVNSTIANNRAENGSDGGGFYGDGGTLTVENSTFSGNYANDGAGAVYIDDELQATISNTTITGNTAATTAEDVNTAISVGGDSTLDLIQSTVTGNSHVGTPIEFYGALYLQGGSRLAGAAHQQKDAQASGEVGAQYAGQVNLIGSIVSGNGDPSKANSFDINSGGDPATVASDHSLIGDVEESVTVDDLGGTIRSTDPMLAPLASNGGPTQTMALLAGSPALDTGPVPVPTFPLNDNDQRGAGFPRVVNGRVDIGAFEVQPVVPAPIDLAPRFTG